MTNLETYWNILKLKHVETYWNMLKHIETCWNILKHIETIIQMFIAFQIRTWWCTRGCFLWTLKENWWSLTSPNIKIQVPVPKRRSRNGLKEHVQNWIYFTMLRKHDQTSFMIRMSFQRKHQPAFSSAKSTKRAQKTAALTSLEAWHCNSSHDTTRQYPELFLGPKPGI